MRSILFYSKFRLRALFRDRLFLAISVLTVAVAVAGLVSVLAVVDSVLVRPLPYRNPENLVLLHEEVPGLRNQFPLLPANPVHFQNWAHNLQSSLDLAAVRFSQFNVSGDGEPERIQGARVSAALFQIIGTAPARGSSFQSEDETPGNDDKAILTDSFWRSHYAADPSIVGRTIRLNDHPFHVVGVLPAAFRFPRQGDLDPSAERSRPVDVFIPLALHPSELRPTGNYDFSVLGRRKPGATLAGVRAAVQEVQTALVDSTASPQERVRVVVTPMQEFLTRPFRSQLKMLQWAAMLLFLIVMANLTAMLVMRMGRRWKEMATQIALGASKSHLFGQLFFDGGVISIAGWLFGLILARWALSSYQHLSPPDLPQLNQIGLNWRVLFLSLSATLGVIAVLCTIPALISSRIGVFDWLRGGQSAGRGGTLFHISRALVCLQMALSIAVLGSAAILVSSFRAITNTPAGFDADHVLAVGLAVPSRIADQQQRFQLIRQMCDDISSLNAVVSCGVSSELPMEGSADVESVSLKNGTEQSDMGQPLPGVQIRYVSANAMHALHIPLKEGRFMEGGDKEVTLLAEKVAQSLSPHHSIIGRTVAFGDGPPLQVIGVVGDIRAAGLDMPVTPMAYRPDWIATPQHVSLLVRTARDPDTLFAPIRSAIHRSNPDVPITELTTVRAIVESTLALKRMQMILMIVLAAIVLGIAALGTYTLVAYSVTARLKEFGIRIALGAGSSQMIRSVLAVGMFPASAGVILGIAVLWLTESLWTKFTLNASALNLPTAATVLALQLGVAALSMLPSIYTVLHTDPKVVMNSE